MVIRRTFLFIFIIIICIFIVLGIRNYRKKNLNLPPFPVKEAEELVEKSSFNIGHKVVSVRPADSLSDISLALWYPTQEKESPYTYKTVGHDLGLASFTSSIAKDAKIIDEKLPLILFYHGAFCCGTQSLFLTEYLAEQGFIVAAPDLSDDIRICESDNSSNDVKRRDILRNLLRIKSAAEQETLAMLKRNNRVPGASYILDEILKLNNNSNSFLFNHINKNAIGVTGHSYGGLTILGLIGTHPDTSFEDSRIKAAVILSGAVFPFQDETSNISIPIFVMQGDNNDDTDLHKIERRLVYENAMGPKYFIKLKNGTHGSFFNGVCGSYKEVEDCQEKNIFAQVINQYTGAFFKKYLRGDNSLDNILKSKLSGVKIHEYILSP